RPVLSYTASTASISLPPLRDPGHQIRQQDRFLLGELATAQDPDKGGILSPRFGRHRSTGQTGEHLRVTDPSRFFPVTGETDRLAEPCAMVAVVVMDGPDLIIHGPPGRGGPLACRGGVALRRPLRVDVD